MDDMMIKLQTLIGHQEEEILSLSSELYLQQKELAALKQQVAELRESIKGLESAIEIGIDTTPEPPPPHY